MTITVNGRTEALATPCSLLDFLTVKGLESETVVLEHNGDIPDRAQWGQTVLAQGDTLEILKFMGGG